MLLSFLFFLTCDPTPTLLYLLYNIYNSIVYMFQKVGGRVKLVKYAKVLTCSYFPIQLHKSYG